MSLDLFVYYVILFRDYLNVEGRSIEEIWAQIRELQKKFQYQNAQLPVSPVAPAIPDTVLDYPEGDPAEETHRKKVIDYVEKNWKIEFQGIPVKIPYAISSLDSVKSFAQNNPKLKLSSEFCKGKATAEEIDKGVNVVFTPSVYQSLLTELQKQFRDEYPLYKEYLPITGYIEDLKKASNTAWGLDTVIKFNQKSREELDNALKDLSSENAFWGDGLKIMQSIEDLVDNDRIKKPKDILTFVKSKTEPIYGMYNSINEEIGKFPDNAGKIKADLAGVMKFDQKTTEALKKKLDGLQKEYGCKDTVDKIIKAIEPLSEKKEPKVLNGIVSRYKGRAWVYGEFNLVNHLLTKTVSAEEILLSILLGKSNTGKKYSNLPNLSSTEKESASANMKAHLYDLKIGMDCSGFVHRVIEAIVGIENLKSTSKSLQKKIDSNNRAITKSKDDDEKTKLKSENITHEKEKKKIDEQIEQFNTRFGQYASATVLRRYSDYREFYYRFRFLDTFLRMKTVSDGSGITDDDKITDDDIIDALRGYLKEKYDALNDEKTYGSIYTFLHLDDPEFKNKMSKLCEEYGKLMYKWHTAEESSLEGITKTHLENFYKNILPGFYSKLLELGYGGYIKDIKKEDVEKHVETLHAESSAFFKNWIADTNKELAKMQAGDIFCVNRGGDSFHIKTVNYSLDAGGNKHFYTLESSSLREDGVGRGMYHTDLLDGPLVFDDHINLNKDTAGKLVDFFRKLDKKKNSYILLENHIKPYLPGIIHTLFCNFNSENSYSFSLDDKESSPSRGLIKDFYGVYIRPILVEKDEKGKTVGVRYPTDEDSVYYFTHLDYNLKG